MLFYYGATMQLANSRGRWGTLGLLLPPGKGAVQEAWLPALSPLLQGMALLVFPFSHLPCVASVLLTGTTAVPGTLSCASRGQEPC